MELALDIRHLVQTALEACIDHHLRMPKLCSLVKMEVLALHSQQPLACLQHTAQLPGPWQASALLDKQEELLKDTIMTLLKAIKTVYSYNSEALSSTISDWTTEARRLNVTAGVVS